MSKVMSKIKEIVVVEKTTESISYESKSIESYEGYYGEKALSQSFIMDCFRKIMGRTLTIIDASIIEKQQNKAMKDLVRGIFSDEMEFVDSLAYDQVELNEAATEATKGLEIADIKSVTIEEALGVK